MKITLEHPSSPGCMCQKAATFQTPLPAPWKHHQLQHKEMTQAITTLIYTLETEMPSAHYTEKGATQRGRGCINTPAAHQCRTPPLGPVLCPPRGTDRVPSTEVAAAPSRLADSVPRSQGHETPGTEFSATLKSARPVEALLSHPLKPATCPGPPPSGQQDPGHSQPS